MDRIIEQLSQDLARGGYSRGTRVEYRKEAERFAEFLGGPIEEASREQVRAYVEEVTGQQQSLSRLKNRLCGLLFLFRRTLGKPEMVSFVRLRSARSVLPEVLSKQEVHALLNCIRTPRMQALAMVMYGSGLRISEAVSLRVEDIDGPRGVIRVMHGKGGVAREAKLSPILHQWLRDYWARERPPRPHLFAGRSGNPPDAKSVRDALSAAAEDAAISKHVTPHVLRHSFATHLLEEGTDVRVVSALLGHASLQSTLRYARVTNKVVRQTPSPLDLLPPVQR